MRKRVGVTAIILMMALAAGCGNPGTAASSSASQASESSTASSTSSQASSEASTEETGSASGSATRQPGDKATFDDFSNDTISFTNASVTYKDGKSIFNAKITYKGWGTVVISVFHVKFIDDGGHTVTLQQTLNTPINSKGSVDIALKYEGDLTASTKVEYLYGFK